MKGKCFIGTSGWTYDHWKEVFYPPDIKRSNWLKYYISQFDTVEINNTFYHLPTTDAFDEWKMEARHGFIYALKGSRYITHMKKLKDPAEPLHRFIGRAGRLEKNLGPILFQLPPKWRCNAGRLTEFVKNLPKDIRFAFEFRDETWFNDDIYGILRENDIALCIYHMPDFVSPVVVTARFVYLRFHGADFLYGGRYSIKVLSRWADLIRLYMKDGLDVYAYFNNDADAHAVANAKELRELVRNYR